MAEREKEKMGYKKKKRHNFFLDFWGAVVVVVVFKVTKHERLRIIL